MIPVSPEDGSWSVGCWPEGRSPYGLPKVRVLKIAKKAKVKNFTPAHRSVASSWFSSDLVQVAEYWKLEATMRTRTVAQWLEAFDNDEPLLLVLLAVSLLLVSSMVFAQSQATTGVIEGTVSDASGAALPGVTVSLTSVTSHSLSGSVAAR